MNPKPFVRFALVPALLLALSTGCARAEPPPSQGVSVTGASNAAAPMPAAAPASRALIVTVDMGLRVARVGDAKAKIRHEVEAAGGYVSNSNARGGDDETATMDLRVPASRTTDLRTSLRAMGDVTSESEKVDDVTEQRADLSARLHNARTQEARLLEIMQQKTGTIGDVIEAEKELSRVRETVERLEAEQRTMDGQIDMATIHLTLTTPSSVAWQTPGRSIARSFDAGLRGAEALATYGAMALAALAPTLVPVLALLSLLLLAVRRSRAKKERLGVATAAP
jgi:hypothetical protein